MTPRTCAEPGCSTILNWLTRGDRCGAHTITGLERNRLGARARAAALSELVWRHRDEFDVIHARHRSARGLPAHPAWRARRGRAA